MGEVTAVVILGGSLQRRQEALGRLISVMEGLGFSYIEAYYGNHKPPREILGVLPDVYATVPLLCRPQAVGVLATPEELGKPETLERLRHLTAWASSHEPHQAMTYLGLIRDSNPLILSQERLPVTQVLEQAVRVGWRELLRDLYVTGWSITDV